jgi:hypothetical protein
MRSFESSHGSREQEVPVSLKVRVTSGCFHREHSPQAYALIDQRLASTQRDAREFDFVEHESGPELLVFLAVATGGLSLAKSVIDLIVVILEARREGVKKGDYPSDPLELIVRRISEGDTFEEETILRIGHEDSVNRAEIESLVGDAIGRVASEGSEER